MDTLKAILSRRSIRVFSDKEIGNTELEEILRAAMYAPSGGNAQPWDFVVIRDKAILRELEITSKYTEPLKTANRAIVVCGNKEKEKFPDLWVQDCSAAIQNIMLAAHNLGIGSTWLGVYPIEDRINNTSKIIGTPNHITPFAIVAMGYPGEEKTMPDRFNLANIHMDKWK